jgi:hypothetical protein
LKPSADSNVRPEIQLKMSIGFQVPGIKTAEHTIQHTHPAWYPLVSGMITRKRSAMMRGAVSQRSYFHRHSFWLE